MMNAQRLTRNRELVTLSLTAAVLGQILGSFTSAAEQPASATSLTIYSTGQPGAIPEQVEHFDVVRRGLGQRIFGEENYKMPGYAVVRQERPIDLSQGRGTVRFTDVASWIDPTTVTFESLTDPAGTSVLEQNYQFDLVSKEKLMQRFLDRPITVQQTRGKMTTMLTGTLLSTAGGIILQEADGNVHILNDYSDVFFPELHGGMVTFPELPGGLITKPTLIWEVSAQKAGKHRTRVTYQTEAMTWWADYNVVFAEGKDANTGVLDVGAWVSIVNLSGAGYPDARLKLIAGDVHRAPKPRDRESGESYAQGAPEAEPVAGFEEKAFFEYHLYTLGRPTTLPDNSTKQIELFPTARNVPCEKVLLYYGLPEGFPGVFSDPMTDREFGTQCNKKVDIYLRFKNAKDIGMGMPLPAGRIRVSKMDPADKSLEFIGEDLIDHTPKDEKVLIKLGSAFDVVGERKQINFEVDTVREWMDEQIEIELRNHKAEPVNVVIKENLYRWVNWEITRKTHEFEKVDARTIHFPVRVEKDGTVKVRYTVHYSW